MRRFIQYKEENHIHPSILFRFPDNSDDAIVINYCILYAKYYIYLEKLKDNNKKSRFDVGFLGYLKYILKIEKKQLYKKNQIAKTYNMLHAFVQNGICNCVLWQSSHSIKHQYL